MSTVFSNLRAGLKYCLQQVATSNGYNLTIQDVYDPPKSVDAMTRFPAINIIWESESVESGAENFSGRRAGNNQTYTILARARLDVYMSAIDINDEMDKVLIDIQEYIGRHHDLPGSDGSPTAFACVYTGSTRHGMDQQKPNGAISIALDIRYRMNVKNPNLSS